MQFAAFVSAISDPFYMVMLLALLGGWHAGLRNAAWVSYVLYVIVLSLFLWGARLYAVSKLKTNWDLSDRPKRVKSLIPLVGICTVFFVLLLLWHNAGLFRFGSSLLVWLIVFSLVTLKTKISGHAGLLVLIIGYAMVWYGVCLWPITLCIPLVGWSRWKLKRHTTGEIIGGALYSVIFLLTLLSMMR